MLEPTRPGAGGSSTSRSRATSKDTAISTYNIHAMTTSPCARWLAPLRNWSDVTERWSRAESRKEELGKQTAIVAYVLALVAVVRQRPAGEDLAQRTKGAAVAPGTDQLLDVLDDFRRRQHYLAAYRTRRIGVRGSGAESRSIGTGRRSRSPNHRPHTGHALPGLTNEPNSRGNVASHRDKYVIYRIVPRGFCSAT
jgi:hypothetical protein